MRLQESLTNWSSADNSTVGITNTCGTCKYFGKLYELDRWDSDKEEAIECTKFHICDLIQHLNGMDLKPEEVFAGAAGVIDGSGYHAAFCVSEEFGCNKWAPRS